MSIKRSFNYVFWGHFSVIVHNSTSASQWTSISAIRLEADLQLQGFKWCYKIYIKKIQRNEDRHSYNGTTISETTLFCLSHNIPPPPTSPPHIPPPPTSPASLNHNVKSFNEFDKQTYNLTIYLSIDFLNNVHKIKCKTKLF